MHWLERGMNTVVFIKPFFFIHEARNWTLDPEIRNTSIITCNLTARENQQGECSMWDGRLNIFRKWGYIEDIAPNVLYFQSIGSICYNLTQAPWPLYSVEKNLFVFVIFNFKDNLLSEKQLSPIYYDLCACRSLFGKRFVAYPVHAVGMSSFPRSSYRYCLVQTDKIMINQISNLLAFSGILVWNHHDALILDKCYM